MRHIYKVPETQKSENFENKTVSNIAGETYEVRRVTGTKVFFLETL